VLYDRVNLLDNARGGTLTFSDGSTVAVNGIPDDGSPMVVEFPARSVTSVRFQVAGGVGSNVGLSEIQANPPDLARGATVSATSVYGAGFEAANAVDGNYATRWASVTGGAATQTFTIDLGTSQSLASVAIDWEYAYATNYTIGVSTTGSSYSTVVTKAGNSTQTTRDAFTPTTARYVQITMTAGALSIYSFWNVRVFGPP
jgi:F5/8 type C domain-containing protein